MHIVTTPVTESTQMSSPSSSSEHVGTLPLTLGATGGYSGSCDHCSHHRHMRPTSMQETIRLAYYTYTHTV